MKAVIVDAFTPFDKARIGKLPDPVAGPGEVVVDVEAVDVNFPDILYIEGKYQNRPAFPFSPGLGAAGRIAALGSGVEGFSIGRKVLVLPHYGAYAEKVKAPAACCFAMPDDMPFEEAAALGLVYQTAYFALTARAMLEKGETVLVLGASGGIGMAAVSLAKALGAGKVIAATRGEERSAFAKGLGADVTVDSAMDNLRDGLREAVYAATDGRGVDVVIDPVGGALNAAALRAMAWQGRMVVVGFASGEIPKIGANYLLVKNIAVSGLQWTDYRDRQPEKMRAAQAEIFAFWREGKLRPAITGTFPLERYGEALGAISRAGARGKFILTIRDN
ncbi:NADPH:quinone oxidoreductase family protein [uncultured Martelella sp.]|uniref:NADPH:quinone oxidoreductase family protein n=1 Tax=uncultured Martelella sp. TaxID=392331 RepID=UPI0029C99610|nr:NADPH:quinone oxidoreductase family protein [uncultured Martelella sp.]